MISKDEIRIAQEAKNKHGTIREAAAALGKSFGWVQRRLQKANVEDMLGETPDIHGLDVKSITFGTDKETGLLVPKWVKTTKTQAELAALFTAYGEGMLERIDPVAEVPQPTEHLRPDLMNFIPIGDLHLGMLAWARETGDGDWDLSIGQDLFTKAIAQLVAGCPKADTLVIAPLGDFLHYDGFDSVTPKSKNQLDTDTRFPKMVEASLDCIEYAVNVGLLTHQSVHLMIQLGNHDPASTQWLRAAFAKLYRRNPRVTVDTSPSLFHYFRFGEVLLGTTHGHTVKMDKLPLLMATDRKEWWGETTRRYWWTGHVHHDQTKDHPGCKCESVRVLPPLDSFAASHGYRGERDMKLITYHNRLGEVNRSTVNADMFGE